MSRTDVFKPYILPIAVGILFALFLFQHRGTERVGKLFGPVMLLWFAAIGALGIASLVSHPVAIDCVNPLAALHFLFTHGWTGYLTLGAVVLAFSGVEALFADMGHFGRKPIILSWYCIVLPALMLNYLGQGALLLHDPNGAAAPFFALVPHWAIFPMVMLSTVATVIASQALISGAFSVTRQAVIMGLAPRYAIRHTSAENRGQVYMPVVNAFLMIGCLAMVLGFRSSDALGNAYGLAVIGTMTITSVVFFIVMRRVWKWPLVTAVPLLVAFLAFDLAFLGANIVKIPQGAWVPLAIAWWCSPCLPCVDRRPRPLPPGAQPLVHVRRGFCRNMVTWEKRHEGSVVFLTFDLDRVPLVGCHPGCSPTAATTTCSSCASRRRKARMSRTATESKCANSATACSPPKPASASWNCQMSATSCQRHCRSNGQAPSSCCRSRSPAKRHGSGAAGAACVFVSRGGQDCRWSSGCIFRLISRWGWG